MTEAVKLVFFLLIGLAVALEIIGDIFFKKWSLENRNLLLMLGLLIYFVGSVFWAVSLRYEYLSKAISVFTVLNLIIVAVIGMVFFKEDLSLVNKIGIGLGVLSVMLVEL